jgi:hypothetical protein
MKYMQSCLNKTNILFENCNIFVPVVYIEDCKEDPRVESGLEAKLAVINDDVRCRLHHAVERLQRSRH